MAALGFTALAGLLPALLSGACAYSPGNSAPSRPPLLIEGLTLQPGTKVLEKSLNTVSDYEQSADKPKQLEKMYLEIEPANDWAGLQDYFNGRLTALGFVAKPEWQRSGDKYEPTRTHYRAFTRVASKEIVVLAWKHYDATEYSSRHDSYDLTIFSGDTELERGF